MQQLTIVQDYILQAVLHHRVIEPLGSSGTAWGGVDFSLDVGVLSDEHDVITDLYTALEDWLLTTLGNGDPVPVIEGIDLNSDEGQKLVAWHQTHRRQVNPDQTWFWTTEWQAGEREASRQIQADETSVYASGEDFLASFGDDKDASR